MLAADDMWNVALLENFAHEIRHARCDEHHLDLSNGLLENLAQLTLADQFSIAILSLKEQVSHVLLSHQLHACVVLIESVAGDMKQTGPFSDHFNELILCCHRLLKSDLLV